VLCPGAAAEDRALRTSASAGSAVTLGGFRDAPDHPGGVRGRNISRPLGRCHSASLSPPDPGGKLISRSPGPSPRCAAPCQAVEEGVRNTTFFPRLIISSCIGADRLVFSSMASTAHRQREVLWPRSLRRRRTRPRRSGRGLHGRHDGARISGSIAFSCCPNLDQLTRLSRWIPV
jgi:hypothetical protein